MVPSWVLGGFSCADPHSAEGLYDDLCRSPERALCSLALSSVNTSFLASPNPQLHLFHEKGCWALCGFPLPGYNVSWSWASTTVDSLHLFCIPQGNCLIHNTSKTTVLYNCLPYFFQVEGYVWYMHLLQTLWNSMYGVSN